MRRRRILAATGSLAVVGVGAALLLTGGGGASAQDEADEEAPTVVTATVARTDLVEREELDGVLGYGEPEDLALGRSGMVTALPAVGTIVDRGGSLAHVDGRTVPLFLGDTPLWRRLEVDAEGPDVRVLEENLTALGFADAGNLTVDEHYTSATAAAVERWQEALGWDETGVVEPTYVVVRPAPVRIIDHLAPTGTQAGGPVVSVTGTERHVTLDLEASRQGLVAAGDEVEVVLPDGTRLPGSVASVGRVVTPGDEMAGTSATIEVVVSLADPAAAGELDEAPVDVSIVKAMAEGVLAVPVEALLALAEGGYAVERTTAAGTELVAVDTGAFAMGLVEVTGDLAEGDEVVVPA